MHKMVLKIEYRQVLVQQFFKKHLDILMKNLKEMAQSI